MKKKANRLDAIKMIISSKDVSSQEELLQAFNRTYPDFRERLKRKIPKLSEQEWRMCCLIKMEVPPSTAAMLLCCTNQAISMRRVRLYQKITGEKGTPELCDSFIRDF